MKLGFSDEYLAFEFVRNLGFTYYGGADLGEMMATVENIEKGDFESWYSQWPPASSRSKFPTRFERRSVW